MTIERHLQQVRDFHERLGIPQAPVHSPIHLPEMEVVLRQTLLYQCGHETFSAIVESDMAKMLSGLVDLAFNALAAVAISGEEVQPVNIAWRQDGSMLSVAKVISDRIHRCLSGEASDYAALYCLSEKLAREFINADFDGAFDHVYQEMMKTPVPESRAGLSQRLGMESPPQSIDLTDSLYE
jgi:hypothetical protein